MSNVIDIYMFNYDYNLNDYDLSHNEYSTDVWSRHSSHSHRQLSMTMTRMTTPYLRTIFIIDEYSCRCILCTV